MGVHAEAPPPRPAPHTPGGRSDLPPDGIAPGWWHEEGDVLAMLAAHCREMSPWDAAVAVFGPRTPRPQIQQRVSAWTRRALFKESR